MKTMKKKADGKFEPCVEGALYDPMPIILKKLNERYLRYEPMFKELIRLQLITHGFELTERTIIRVVGKVLFESEDVFYRFNLRQGINIDDGSSEKHHDSQFVQFKLGKLVIGEEETINYLAGWEQSLKIYTGDDFIG